MALTLPKLSCCPLSEFEPDNWKSVDEAFSRAPSCALQQAWRAAPEAGFEPARVRVGWRPDALWVDVHLTDKDIFNGAAHLNDETYNLGDIFEIFVRPIAQETYYEFHVTPNNQQMQLRWPTETSIAQFTGSHQSLTPFFVGDFLQSYTDVQAKNNFWRVLARVPATVASTSSIRDGDQWMFSFSRYDCTRGVIEPTHSSTSPHALVNFHRQCEWGRLTFQQQ